ncbi:MAG: AI-2E family transporter [Methylotenera sp.]|nr:AI-2E family transporter [Methylotenera sp.]
MTVHSSQTTSNNDIAAWVLMAFALIFAVKFGLLPALISGLLVFEVVHLITPMIAKRFSNKRKDNYSKLWAVGIIVFIIVSLLALAVAGLVAFLRSDAGSVTVLLAKMAQILEDSRKILPAWLLAHLPSDAIAFKELLTAWLRTHADQLQIVGKEAGRVTAHVIIGMIVGGMLALREAVVIERYQPFSRALIMRISLFGDAFKRIVFAQIRISAINTFFTAIYLAAVLPMLGIHLPLVKTMIAITFVVGLIPVIGNLISNTVIVVVSLSQSLGVAVGSLAYLVVIHKFEYFLNARIVGTQIQARAWELLIAMLCMEAAFGLVGVVAAPIYYAYIKAELRLRKLI